MAATSWCWGRIDGVGAKRSGARLARVLRRVAVVAAAAVVVVATAVVVVAVVVATAVTASAAASGLIKGASSSARAQPIMSSSDGSGSLSSNSLSKRSADSAFQTSGWPARISAGHSSGTIEELEGEGGIESNSIVSSASCDHKARALCRGATWSHGVRGEFGGADGEADCERMKSDMLSEDEWVWDI